MNDLGRRTDWLSIGPAVPYLGPQPGNTFLDSLLMLALRHAGWQQEPELWKPVAGSPRQQFHAFARHLFPGYDVPAFLDTAWFEGFTPHGESHRDWFLHIRSGQNIRSVEVPVVLTSMAAHHFLQAPENDSIVSALRWGQILALGGDASLAHAVAETRLSDILPDEPFWHSVLHFFVNQPDLSPHRVGPLVDYIHARKFGETTDFNLAPEPGFSMKGRTLPALQKRMEEWHALLAKEAKRPSVSWEPSGIAPFVVTERDPFGATNDWTLLELTTNKALQEEGSEMRNCVRTYAEGCQRGTTSIWSLRIRSGRNERYRSLLTIEVNNTRRAIVQVRGMCNKALPSMHHSPRMKIAEEMLRRWARESRLSTACTL
ncbi:MAG: hypothetical protein JWN14_2431 [Chthonomonadales bacterium]|nr:hypothetical protein [Chthonomonadales bacterium]